MSIEVNINLKTVNGESLIGTGNIVVGGGLTIGTTAITSGVDNRILFQSAGVTSQDSNFTYDPTLKRLVLKAIGAGAVNVPFSIRNSVDTDNLAYIAGNGLAVIGINSSSSPTLIIDPAGSARATLRGGTNQSILLNSSGWNNLNGGSGGWDIEATGGEIRQRNGSNYTLLSGNYFGIGRTPSARLDVQAQGALSTDLAFRVRNSANTENLAQINGNGTFRIGDANGGLNNSVSYISDGRLFLSKSGGNFIELNPGTTANRLFGGANGWEISGTAKTVISTTGLNAYFFDGTIQIASGLNVSGGATNTLHVENGIAPTTSVLNQFKMYSADIVAGNAAPHFRTENGDVIKLHKQSSAGISTVSDIVTVLTNLGFLG